jgi:hypothetical protein
MPRAKNASRFRHSKKAKAAWERSSESRAASRGELGPSALAASVSPETSTQPPAAAGAHDDGEVKSIKYFGVAITPGDAREIAEIEAWDDETLQGIQDCRSPHDQWLISLVRSKKIFDKDREAASAAAVTARLERLAATAPARAAARRRYLERKRAERACAPPATRSSEARKRQRDTERARMRFLGDLGGKRPPPPTQPPGVHPPCFPTRAAAAAAAAEEEEEEEEAATSTLMSISSISS